jgi:hypothetical protein
MACALLMEANRMHIDMKTLLIDSPTLPQNQVGGIRDGLDCDQFVCLLFVDYLAIV